MRRSSTIDPVRPRRGARFTLTPLIDIIFLLLIFFMLSSQIAPYSLLEISAASGAEGGEEADVATAPAPGARADLLFVVMRNRVRAGAETISTADFGSVLDDHPSPRETAVTLLVSRGATMQDLSTALEALSARRFESVTVLGAAS